MLLDSNVIIWWLQGNQNLGTKARNIVTSSDHTLIASIFTLFEIELKRKSGKLRLDLPVLGFLESYNVRVYSPPAEELADLLKPQLSQKDPFDRALVGLANIKKWPLLTSDEMIIAEGQQYAEIIDSRL